MKKAKAHMVRVTKDFARRLVMNADTPYEAYEELKKKYSVAKNRQDFTTLDAQWNEFKVADANVDPDKVFATLDEHSKKLGEFGEKYEKDALQTLSKIQVAFPNEYEHVFTILNTAEEHKKDAEVQLETAKHMIKTHYDTKIKPTGTTNDDYTMMCMYISDNKSKGPEGKKNEYKCDHCGKKGHTAYRNGKPFFRSLIASLQGGNDGRKKNSNNTFKGKCYNCNKVAGHMSRDCPEPRQNKGAEDETADINSLQVLKISVVEFNEQPLEVSYVEKDKEYTDMLGDTGAQGHVAPATYEDMKKKPIGTVNMANGAKAKIYRSSDTTVKNVNGSTFELKNRRTVEGLHTPIISLTQLMNEGWSMNSTKNKQQKNEINMTKDGKKLTFVEKKNNLFYLKAKIVKEILVANYTTTDYDKITKAPVVYVSDDEDSDDDDAGMPTLIERNDLDSDSDSEDEYETTRTST